MENKKQNIKTVDNMNNIENIIKSCFHSNITPLLWGDRGIGKSQFIKDLAEKEKMDIVDLRLGQLEPMDLMGLPVKTEDRTKWLKPEWFPVKGKGILFLDEINRAHPDVMQSIFQLVFDRKMLSHKLPENWKVVCAANYNNDSYSVNEMDEALMDRFLHIDFKFDKHSWISWAKKKHIHKNIINIINDDILSFKNTDSNLNLTTTPRSLEMLHKMIFSGKLKKQNYELVVKGLCNKNDVPGIMQRLQKQKNIRLFDDEEIKLIKKGKITQDYIYKKNCDILNVFKFHNYNYISRHDLEKNLLVFLSKCPKDISFGFLNEVKKTHPGIFKVITNAIKQIC